MGNIFTKSSATTTNDTAATPVQKIVKILKASVQPPGKWDNVIVRKGLNEPSDVWSARIYKEMVLKEPSLIVPASVQSLANQHLSANLLNLDKHTADNLCTNPCYWASQHPRNPAKALRNVEASGLCKCVEGGHSEAANFPNWNAVRVNLPYHK